MSRLFLLGFLLIGQNALAQLTLLKDIDHIFDAQTSGLNPQYLTDVGGTLFFSGFSDKGFELWKSDGTLAGTVLVKDIVPGSISSSPTSFVNVNGTLFFLANDGVHGKELWKSDGTEAGTIMVKDISFGRDEAYYESSNLIALKAAGNYLYFLQYSNVGNYNLWRSDGTSEGTFIILESALDNWDGFSIVEISGIAYFVSRDPVSGYELWKTDGTKEGTSLLKDIVPGLQSSAPRNLIVYNNNLFFTCYTSAGYEVWKSDGTDAGTIILKDIETGPSNYEPRHFHVINNTLIFQAYDGSSVGLWKSDGTEMGTVKILNTEGFSSSASTETMIFYTIQIIVGFHYETKLWRTDGTEAGTILVKQFVSSFYGSQFKDDMLSMNEAIYFAASSGSDNPNDIQLWRSDGTTAGTFVLTDVTHFDKENGILFNTKYPNDFAVINSALYFCTNDLRKGNELWKTDGTEAGTMMITDMPEASYGSEPSDFTKLNELIIFSAGDEVGSVEIWRTDKTAQGTFMLKDIFPGGPFGNSSLPNGLTTYHDYVYFSAFSDVTTGNELWRTDGSTTGTELFKDFNPTQFESSYPANFKVLNDVLLFTVNVDELWKTDGTIEGTKLVKDITPGKAPISTFVEFGDEVYFLVVGELWKSDGTTLGTKKVELITSMTYNSLIATGDKLYLSISDNELWVSDGTTTGTKLVKKFTGISSFANTGGYSTLLHGTLFFKAKDDSSTDFALWRTDGTAANTSKVTDLYLGFPGIERIAYANGYVFFTAYDQEHGTELWKTDGTSAGVQRLTDIWEGVYNSDPSNFIVADDHLYFTAYDGSTRGLWKSNGEASGTLKVTNDPGISLDRLHSPSLIDNTIFIRGYEISTGEEVYMYDVEVTEPVTGNEVLTNNQIFIYPNPTSQKLRIQTFQVEGQKEIRVINTSGVEFANEKYSNIDFDLDVSAYPTGLYMLQVISSKGIWVTKFIKK